MLAFEGFLHTSPPATLRRRQAGSHRTRVLRGIQPCGWHPVRTQYFVVARCYTHQSPSDKFLTFFLVPPPTLTASAGFFPPTEDLLSIRDGQALRRGSEVDVTLYLMGGGRVSRPGENLGMLL